VIPEMGAVDDLYRRGLERLEKLGEEAELEARVLLLEACGMSEERFFAEPERSLTEEQERRYFELIEKRVAGIPTAYLLGRKEFWSLTLKVGSGVLIPRPETELVVERVLALVRRRRGGGGTKSEPESCSGEGLLVADIGTGSGCLALALGKELPEARIVATDVSAGALDIARENARLLGIRNVSFCEGDLFSPLGEEGLQGQFDVIVSNPPYVREDEWEALAVEIREHEPREALVAGATGLEVIVRLVHGAGRYLKPRGYLVFEIGYGQMPAVKKLFGEGWGKVESFDDLAGVPRVVVAHLR